MRKEFNRAQRKMNDLLKLGECLPSSVQTPLRCYARQLTQLDTNLSAFKDEDALHETLSELEKEVSTLQSKLKKAKMKNRKDKKLASTSSTVNLDGSIDNNDNSSVKKRRRNRADEAPSSPSWESQKITYEEKIKALTDTIEKQQKELTLTKNQQQEASANVKKLAQVVKLMKSKYDTLKANVESNPTTQNITLPESLTKSSDGNHDAVVSSLTDSTDTLRLSQISFTARDYEVPLLIQTEEITTIIHHPPNNQEEEGKQQQSSSKDLSQNLPSTNQNQDENLKKENESLKKEIKLLEDKISQAASLDSLANLISDDPLGSQCYLPRECSLLSLHYIDDSNNVPDDCFWNSLPKPFISSFNHILPYFENENEENLIQAILNLDSSKITRNQIFGLSRVKNPSNVKEYIENTEKTEGQKKLSNLIEKIPNFCERIFCWNFINSYEEECINIENRLEIITNASEVNIKILFPPLFINFNSFLTQKRNYIFLLL